ncbi:ferritin-like domain-containing protein [Halobaculum limi]|uniref:ferritin-like domain-containing protein n=1 Tax=Halobaculum limi TaxID=3031916 RepID=UPI0024077361|nr:ferritin-like domain-containing protein [Halobaculum sp. YSMS11]
MTDPRRGSNATDSLANRLSRRKFSGALAAAGALGLAGCAGNSGGGSTPTPEDEMDTPMETEAPMDTETETEETEMAPPNPDVDVLNYALTLEHLENAFYREGLEMYSDDELMMADSLSSFSETLRMQVPEYLAVVGDHEAAHVDAIAATIEDLGGTPVEEAEYDFGYSTPSEFLATAGALENTGVAAYTGAAAAIKQNAVLGAAAGIQSVEARHASFLNLINGEVPYPNAVEEAKSVDEILEIAGQFITSEVSSPAPLDGEDEPMADRKADNDVSDVDVLNYALTLEHLENAFYREGLETYSDDELMDASVLSDYGEELRMNVPDHLRLAGEHEAAHVSAISDTVEQLGGTPVEEAEYDFGYTNPSEFLGVARALENTGVSAYAGQAGTVTNDAVFGAAVGIHGVEARHAALLNELNVESPFPMAVDEPRTMSEVQEIASQFIVE